MSFKDEIKRGVDLLWLCQDLQTEKDGIERPRNHEIDRGKIDDQFAKDISRAAGNMTSLLELIPMKENLASLGRKLESDGTIQVSYGEDYATAALKFLMSQYGLK